MFFEAHQWRDFLLMVTAWLEILSFEPSSIGFLINLELNGVIRCRDSGHIPFKLIELSFVIEPVRENKK
jgi:hypothetical protein